MHALGCKEAHKNLPVHFARIVCDQPVATVVVPLAFVAGVGECGDVRGRRAWCRNKNRKHECDKFTLAIADVHELYLMPTRIIRRPGTKGQRVEHGGQHYHVFN